MARQPKAEPPDPADPLEAAAKRLARAVAVLDTRLGSVKEEARQSAGSLFDYDRTKLADDLDRATAREKELRTAGEAASKALDRAISELRAATDLPGAA